METNELVSKISKKFTSDEMLGEFLSQYLFDEEFEKELYILASKELYTYMNSYTSEYNFSVILSALTFVALKYYDGSYWEHVYEHLKLDFFKMSDQVFSSKIRECLRENLKGKIKGSRLIELPVINSIIPFNYMDAFFIFCYDIYFYNFRCSLKDFSKEDLKFIYDSLRTKMSDSSNEFTVKGLNKTYVLLKSTQNMIVSSYGIDSLINVTEKVIRMIDRFYWDKPLYETFDYYKIPYSKWVSTVNYEEKTRKIKEAKERTEHIRWIPKFIFKNNEVYLETREDNISDVYEKRHLEMIVYENDVVIYSENNLEIETIIGGYRVGSKRFRITNPFGNIRYVLKCKEQVVFESEQKLYRNDVLMFTSTGIEIKNNTNHNNEEIIFVTKKKFTNDHSILKNDYYITRIEVDSTMQFKIGDTVVGFNEMPFEGINGIECLNAYFDFKESNKIYSKIHNVVFNYSGDIEKAVLDINKVKQKVTEMDDVEIKKVDSIYCITLHGKMFENNHYLIKLFELGNKKILKEYCFILDEEFSFRTEFIQDNVYLFHINSSLYETEPLEWSLTNKWEFPLECPIEDEDTYHTIIFKLKSPIYRFDNKQWHSFKEGIWKDEMSSFEYLDISGMTIKKIQLFDNQHRLLLEDIPFKQLIGIYKILTSSFISYSSYKYLCLKIIDINLKEYDLTIANELVFKYLDLSLDEETKSLKLTPFYIGNDAVEIKLKYKDQEEILKCNSGQTVVFNNVRRSLKYRITVEYMNYNTFSFEELDYRPFIWIGNPIPDKTMFNIETCELCLMDKGIEEFVSKKVDNVILVVNKLIDEKDHLYDVSLIKRKDGKLVYLRNLKEIKMNVINRFGLKGKIKCVITEQEDLLLYDPYNETIYEGEHKMYSPIEEFTLKFYRGSKNE